MHERICEGILGLYTILPVSVVGGQPAEQCAHFMDTVDEAGPGLAHGTLSEESYMVFFKTMCTSRKNICAGAARLYGLTEHVFYWNMLKEVQDNPRADQDWRERTGFSWTGVRRSRQVNLDTTRPLFAFVAGLVGEQRLPSFINH